MSQGFQVCLDRDDLTGLYNRVNNLNTDPVFKKLGERLLNKAKLRFQLGVDPEGKPWKPSKKLHKTRGVDDPKRRGQTLIGKTRKLSSIGYTIEGDSLIVGPPPLPYAAIHEFGGQAGRGLKVTIRARPYMQTDLDESDMTFLQRVITKVLMI